MLLPLPPVIEAFDRIVGPFRRGIRNNIETNGTLTALRDSLLPKLLSGEVRVKDAERIVESGASG
jgi:type I restriction enzyme S subunit